MYQRTNLKRLRCLFFLMLTLLPSLFIFANEWNGPTQGPVAQKSKYIVFVASNLKNGGVAGVYRGFESAASELGWKTRIFDGEGDFDKLRKGLSNAINSYPDGIVLGGFQPDDFAETLSSAKKFKIAFVGWHAAEKPGPHKDIFVNISTDPLEVAKIAVEYAIKNGKEKLGFVLFNDSRYSVANAKTNKMREIIEQCKKCKVLSVENIPISKAASLVSEAVPRLNTKFAMEWTHTLAINDVYFDNMNFPLADLKRKDIINISAGDGSNKAFSRIKSGLSQQIATVAEPLNAQGWQIIDEMNRAFSGSEPSGYVAKPILVSLELLKKNVGIDGVEVDLTYKDEYLKIWNKK